MVNQASERAASRWQRVLWGGLLCSLVLLAAGAAEPEDSTLLEQAEAKGWVRRVIRPESRDYHGIRERWAVSDLVLLGRVVNRAVRLSEDGRSVWTDYTIEILTLYRSSGNPLATGSTVTARVEGGSLVARDRVITVANEFFPALPWVREHVFFLLRNAEQPDSYRFLGEGQGVFRHDEDDRLRCHLPEKEWGSLCRRRDGGPWRKLVKDMRKSY